MNINAYVSAEVPHGTPLARVNEGGVWVWPQGIGVGSVLMFDLDEWDRIAASVERARAAYVGMAGYAATEGNGDAL